MLDDPQPATDVDQPGGADVGRVAHLRRVRVAVADRHVEAAAAVGEPDLHLRAGLFQGVVDQLGDHPLHAVRVVGMSPRDARGERQAARDPRRGRVDRQAGTHPPAGQRARLDRGERQLPRLVHRQHVAPGRPRQPLGEHVARPTPHQRDARVRLRGALQGVEHGDRAAVGLVDQLGEVDQDRARALHEALVDRGADDVLRAQGQIAVELDDDDARAQVGGDAAADHAVRVNAL